MNRRGFVLLCTMMTAVTLTFAQSPDSKRDPLTGTWAGEFILKGSSGKMSITMELKFDGKTKVSGTFTGFPSPGDVKAGTFDSKTGALKLQLGKTAKARS